MHQDILNVYLSGPMYLGKEQATEWRNEFKDIIAASGLCIRCIDPCNRFYDDKNELLANGSWVVKIDKMEIANSHIVVVNATEPGWGTPMEQYIAWETGKFVVAFDDKPFSSIWTKAHSHVLLDSHILAANWICKNISQFGGTF